MRTRCRVTPASSEHRIRVRRLVRNPLQHVPVLDDFSVVVQSKDIDSRPLAIIRPVLETVEDEEMVFGQRRGDALHLMQQLPAPGMQRGRGARGQIQRWMIGVMRAMSARIRLISVFTPE